MKSRRRIDWAQAAVKVAEAIPRSRLHPRVLAWTEGKGAQVRRPWSVAFSGGADSLCLLLLLWAHWPERRTSLRVLHFDHRLRGAESRGDAAFCRSVCRSLDLRLSLGVWSRSSREKVSEAEAREARLAFFEKEMLRSGSRALWLGHQQDDIAESLLMRLARGSGTSGLAAPRPIQRYGSSVRLRPLLALNKSGLAGVLRSLGLLWRDDSTNAGADYLRNRVRSGVLPAWNRACAGRDALAGAALARELLEEDDDALEIWLDEINPFSSPRVLRLEPLSGRPNALWRRALRRWLAATPYRGDLSRQGFELLLSACRKGQPTRQSLGRESFAVIKDGALRYRSALPGRRQRLRQTK